MRSSILAPTLLAAGLLLPVELAAQRPDAARLADSIQAEIVGAYVTGDHARLEAARALAERATIAYPEDPWAWHYLGYALYRLGVGAMDVPAGDELLASAEEALRRSAALQPLAETHALLASVYGLMIGRDPARAMDLGARIDAEQATALRLDPDNPRVQLLRGIGAFHTPAAYGGGPDRALEHLEQARDAFAADDPPRPAPRWGRADVHVWLGQVRARLGDAPGARSEYETALAIAPEYAWVRDELLPALETGTTHAH